MRDSQQWGLSEERTSELRSGRTTVTAKEPRARVGSRAAAEGVCVCNRGRVPARSSGTAPLRRMEGLRLRGYPLPAEKTRAKDLCWVWAG